MHVSSNRPVSEDEEEDDVFSLRSLYYGRAGGDVMGCRRPKLKIFQNARIISTMEFSSVCFSTVFCYKENRSVIALAIYLFYIWLFILLIICIVNLVLLCSIHKDFSNVI